MEEYNLNLAEDNSSEMSNLEVFTSTIDEEYNFETKDIIKEKTIIQKINDSLKLKLEDNKMYKAKFNGTKIFSTELNREKLGLAFEVFDGDLSKKEYINLYFYSNNEACIEVSIWKLKKFAKMFGIELDGDDLEDLHSMKRALAVLEGNWVEVKQTTRYDEKSKNSYSNIEVVSVLGKEYESECNI